MTSVTLINFNFKKLMLISFLLCILISQTFAQIPQYYNYNNVGTSSNSFPFGQPAGKAVNWLFLPGEFNQPTPLPSGYQFSKVYFFMTNTGSRLFSNLVIAMAQDTITSFTTGTFYSGTMDTVFYKDTITLSSTSLTWMSIPLSKPFNYNPTKSLIVMVGQCSAPGTNMSLRQNTTTLIKRVWSSGGCPFTPYASGDASIVNFGVDVVQVPVELTSFTATANANIVNLKWSTATEKNNYGFEIERNQNFVWEKIGFVKGNGTTTEKHDYIFNDKFETQNLVKYRLKQVDFNGAYEYSPEVEVENLVPFEFSLEQNYPNPFNPNSKIKYQIAKPGFVTLKVYDVLGTEVANLVNETKDAGFYEVEFVGAKLSSGVYFYELKAGEFRSIKKMNLLK